MVQKEKKYITWEGLNQHAKNVGKKIKEYDAGVIGGYNGSFPLTAATKGNIYLLPATKKYYVCIENYNGSQLTAPNANFEELSVYTNRSKLDNLIKYITFDTGNTTYDVIESKIAEYINLGISDIRIVLLGMADISLSAFRFNPNRKSNIRILILKWNSQGIITINNIEADGIPAGNESIGTSFKISTFGRSIDLFYANARPYIIGGYGYTKA